MATSVHVRIRIFINQNPTLKFTQVNAKIAFVSFFGWRGFRQQKLQLTKCTVPNIGNYSSERDITAGQYRSGFASQRDYN
jgi:hypothetical protein